MGILLRDLSEIGLQAYVGVCAMGYVRQTHINNTRNILHTA